MGPIRVRQITLVRGNVFRCGWRFIGISAEGDEWALAIRGPGIRTERVAGAEGSGLTVSADEAEITVKGTTTAWPRTTVMLMLTVEETRKIQAGLIDYELERRVEGEGGEQKSYIVGQFRAIDSLPSD